MSGLEWRGLEWRSAVGRRRRKRYQKRATDLRRQWPTRGGARGCVRFLWMISVSLNPWDIAGFQDAHKLVAWHRMTLVCIFAALNLHPGPYPPATNSNLKLSWYYLLTWVHHSQLPYFRPACPCTRQHCPEHSAGRGRSRRPDSAQSSAASVSGQSLDAPVARFFAHPLFSMYHVRTTINKGKNRSVFRLGPVRPRPARRLDALSGAGTECHVPPDADGGTGSLHYCPRLSTLSFEIPMKIRHRLGLAPWWRLATT